MKVLLLLLLLLLQSGCLRQNKNNNNGVLIIGVMAQEAPNPQLHAEPFAAISSFRQDFCTRSANLSMDDIDIGGLLQGAALNAAIGLGEFIKFDSKNAMMTLNADYPGLVARLLDEICLRAGCTWRNSYTILGPLPPNATWSELLIWSTETYDISVDWWMRSAERMRHGAAFIEPWYDGSIIMVTKKQSMNDNEQRFNAVSWLAPFDNYVWLMIAVTILVSAFIYWCLELLNPDSDQRKYQLDAVETLWLLATAFAGAFQIDPQTAPARLLTFSIAFWALLMGAAYTANLASFLVVKTVPQFTIESIEQAVHMKIPMCVYEATPIQKILEERFPSYAQAGLLIPATERGIYEGIGTKCQVGITEVSAWKSFQYDATINGDCSLYWVGRAFDFVPAGFAIKADSGDKCTSLVKTVFDVHMNDIIKEGKLEELWDEHLQATATVFCPDSGGGSSSDSDEGAEATSRFLQVKGYDMGPEDADNGGRSIRQLAAAPNVVLEGAGDGDQFSDTTQLTLHNMGGVFLLHGIMSTLALLWSVISWSRNKRCSSSAAARSKESDGALVDERCIINDAASSIDHDEFFDASTSVEEFRLKMNGSTRTNTSSVAAGDVLRAEVNQELKSIGQKLAALLDKKEQ